jgi:hypothetical protein
MPYFLTIREGDAPEGSYPVFATADPEIIGIVAKALARKLAPSDVDVRLVKKPKEPPQPKD